MAWYHSFSGKWNQLLGLLWTGSVNAFTDLDDRGIPALGAGTKSIVPV